MRKLLSILVACVGALAVGMPAASASTRGQCGISDARPLWVDFADTTVPFWSTVFARQGVVAAAADAVVLPQLRIAGARTVYFDLAWKGRVGSPSRPAPAETMAARADALFERAAQTTGCTRPLIALNELFGASTTTPWSETNARYRANVLAFARRLAARGARPFLLVSSAPFTGGEAAGWWRQVAQVSDVVLEVYFSGRSVHAQGPNLGNRRLRTTLRTRARSLLAVGVPPARLGVMLQLGSTPHAGGREGLTPATAWLEVVKWEALAARRVARELRLASIWSWGWGTFNRAGDDPVKRQAACVWLWTRDHRLCDGPAAAGPGWDASLTEGQAQLDPGVLARLGSAKIRASAVAALGRVTKDRDVALTALVQRVAESERIHVGAAAVREAERDVIRWHFGGSRAAYARALARAGATADVARGVLADELRRAAAAASLHVPAPSDRAVWEYYATYAPLKARLVRVTPTSRWLGGRARGYALDSLAPPPVFAIPTGATRTIRTPTGSFRVEALADAGPLGELPIAAARPAIRTALAALAREQAYARWTARRQRSAIDRMAFARDRLPQVAAVDLTDYLPFLALPL